MNAKSPQELTVKGTNQERGPIISGNYNPAKAASALKISLKDFQTLVDLGEVRGNPSKITPKEIVRLKRQREVLLTLLARPSIPRQAVKAGSKKAPRVRPLKDVFTRPAPLSVTLHLGPTNSGKTFNALNALKEAGAGTYASPLRMLAFEAYNKLKEQLGEDKVGLRTGEESINPDAPILCVTPEVAPLSGKLLVLDEVQWLKDKERGWAWTQLLLSDYQHFHICGAPEAEDIVKQLMSGIKVETKKYLRLAPIRNAGLINIRDVPPRSVVVAFSKRKVLSLARQLIRDDVRPSVLYGGLPPQVRREELARFNSGETDIMVATDVIGHGVNMPVDNVVFAENIKFDGEQSRPLETWEMAQIAGRAGRFGLSDEGRIYGLTNLEGFEVDKLKLSIGARAAAGIISAGDPLTEATLAPNLEDLSVRYSYTILEAIEDWAKKTEPLLEGTVLKPYSILRLRERFANIDHFLTAETISVPKAWSLVNAPLGLLSFAEVTDMLETKKKLNLPLMDSESSLRVVEDLYRITRIMGPLSPYNLLELEKERVRLTKKISVELDLLVRNNKFGICETCQGHCAPFYSTCFECYQGASKMEFSF